MPLPSEWPSPGEPLSDASDDRLIASIRGGDPSALRAFMTKYDRLVRYAIFRSTRDRCLRDPQWLDSVAADAWNAFILDTRRSPTKLRSARALLLTITRNRAVSALRESIRRDSLGSEPLSEMENEELADATITEPAGWLAMMEDLEAVRQCLATLSLEEQRLAQQLEAILEKRWVEAAATLGIPESTLRSRWIVVLSKLRECLETKTGRNLAPGGPERDSS